MLPKSGWNLSMNRENLRRALALLFYALVFFIPLGTRRLLYQFTPGFHEYETAFVYFSDILIAVFLISSLFFILEQRHGGNFQIPISNFQTILESKVKNSKNTTLFIFLFFLTISIFFATDKWLAI